MQIFVRPNGHAQCLYSDDIELTKIGAVDIRRASHVEPDHAKPGEWIADLSPVGGPLFTGFKSRDAALKAEATWLNEKMTHCNVCVVQ